MSSTLYQLYRKKVFTLANTLVFRLDAIATTINKYVEAYGFDVDWSDRSTWKYYLNLAGLYHPIDEARLNEISGGVSTKLQIKIAGATGPVDADFTVDLINSITGDTAIANEYRFGTYYYNELISRYPDFEELILGILNPIPLSVSINSLDGDILYCGGYVKEIVNDFLGKRVIYSKTFLSQLYDEGLIEDNETNLIPEIEKVIKGYLTRWVNEDFILVDDLYLPAFLGVLTSNLPMTIMNIRLDNCLTPQVHSYHVQEFLESHGRLAKYIPAIPLKQRLFLYRNIRYIEKNIGKQETFKLLVDNILTPLKVPLSGYTLRHSLHNQPDNIYPEARTVREIINFSHVGNGKDIDTILSMLIKEKNIAVDNNKELVNTAVEIEQKVITSAENVLPSKVLESHMLDLTDAITFPFAAVLLNLWIYTASQGTYNGTIFVTHPTTGDRLHLTPLNALILMFYCLNKGYDDITLVNVPSIVARMIPKDITPGLLELRAVVDSSVLSDDVLNDLIGTSIPLLTFNSATAFYDSAKEIHAELMRRYRVYTAVEDVFARGYAEYATSVLYRVETLCELSNQTYADWLQSNGLLLDSLTRDDFVELGLDLMKQGTGGKNNTSEVLRAMHKAVISIMKQYSSYSVQYISNLSNGDIHVTEPKTTRLGNLKVKLKSSLRIPVAQCNVLDNSANFHEMFNTFVNSTSTVNEYGDVIPVP